MHNFGTMNFAELVIGQLDCQIVVSNVILLSMPSSFVFTNLGIHWRHLTNACSHFKLDHWTTLTSNNQDTKTTHNIIL